MISNNKALFLVLSVLFCLYPTSIVSQGAIYGMTNEPSGNRIVAFNRDVNGVLTFQAYYPTGGIGVGNDTASGSGFISPLNSQKSLLYRNGRLFTVNAGDNTVSMFAVSPIDGSLTLLDRQYSGGQYPVGLELSQDGYTLYVLNVGGRGRLTTLRVRDGTELLRGSAVSLNQGYPFSRYPVDEDFTATNIALSDDGDWALVTFKGDLLVRAFRTSPATGRILDGLNFFPITTRTVGPEPFDSEFVPGTNILLVAQEASAGPFQNESGIWSMRFSPLTGRLVPLDSVVFSGSFGLCWFAFLNQSVVYMPHLSRDYTGVTVDPSTGDLTVIEGPLDNGALIASQGFDPLDTTIVSDPGASVSFLYSLENTLGSLCGYVINHNTLQLTANGCAAGLPNMSAQGIAGF